MRGSSWRSFTIPDPNMSRKSSHRKSRIASADGGRPQPVALGAEVLAYRREELARRQDAVGAEEAEDLHAQREKRDQVDDTERAQEEPARPEVRRRSRRCARCGYGRRHASCTAT